MCFARCVLLLVVRKPPPTSEASPGMHQAYFCMNGLISNGQDSARVNETCKRREGVSQKKPDSELNSFSGLREVCLVYSFIPHLSALIRGTKAANRLKIYTIKAHFKKH